MEALTGLHQLEDTNANQTVDKANSIGLPLRPNGTQGLMRESADQISKMPRRGEPDWVYSQNTINTYSLL